MSKLLRSLMTKEQLWANLSCRSVKKSDMSDLLVIRANHSFLRAKNSYSFFLCPRVHFSHHSLLSCSLLKSKRSDSLSLLFTKEWPWANLSCCSLQKSDLERFSQVAHDTREMGVIHPFLQVNFSFAHKKTSDLLEKPISEFPNLDKMGY